MMKSWTKFLGEKTQSNHRAKGLLGNIFRNENVAFCAPFLHSLQGPRVVWDVLLTSSKNNTSNIGCISKLESNMEIKRLDGCVSIKVGKQHGNQKIGWICYSIKVASNMEMCKVKNQHRFVVCSCELVVFWNIWILDINISCPHDMSHDMAPLGHHSFPLF